MSYPEAIFDQEVQKFIQENEHKNTADLALQSHGKNLSMAFLLDQIKARKKAKDKLPSYYANRGFVFPPGVSIEQSSSEATANYKASLFSGKSFIDITGGLGIDVLAFSNTFEEVVHIERDEVIQSCANQNFKTLGKKNISSYHTDGISFIKESEEPFDYIYLDPARRDKNKSKVFLFEDCEPNIIDLQDQLFEKAKIVILKASPLIDIKQSIEQLKTVNRVIVVSLKNECKEVLFELKKEQKGVPEIVCVNLEQNQPEYIFNFEEESETEVSYSTEGAFLFEPNASIFKAGGFKSIAQKFNLKKVSPNSHLYFSDEKLNTFPGKQFKIIEILPYDGKKLKSIIPDLKASVACRNFGKKPEDVKKKLKLKEDNTKMLFASRDLKNKPFLVLGERV